MGALILKGIITGLILSLPFGPIGVYCMELTIVEGKWKAYMTALGMVTVDVIYSLVSLLFISKVEDLIIEHENKLAIFLGIVLMAISLRKLLSRIEIKDVKIEIKSMVQNYITGFLFALANISSILAITVIFATLRVFDVDTKASVMAIAFGVLAGGSGLWFTTTSLISHYKGHIGKENLIKLIKLANLVIFILALLIVLNALRRIFL